MCTAQVLSRESVADFLRVRAVVLGAALEVIGSSASARAGQGTSWPASVARQGSSSPLRASRLDVMEANFGALISAPIRLMGISGRPGAAQRHGPDVH